MIDHVLGAGPWETTAVIALLILILYPVLGSFYWSFGALAYRFLGPAVDDDTWEQLAPPEDQPKVTIMITAHNEELMIESTIVYLLDQLLTRLRDYSAEALLIDCMPRSDRGA